jgi:hypothetical protein
VLKRLIDESVHYFVVFGLALIGLGVYLEIESKSSDKHSFSALAFLVGAWWLGTPIWFAVKPRLKAWWKARHR